ncbi:MAG: hypothetical protein HY913_00555 [Desulfomonile tiedjei]|nr:hypothetical protein [Desulfomonile tiedjei]
MTNESTSESHKKLAEQGWQRRFTAEEPRLSEMKELYESLGLEVLIEPGMPEDDEECRSCFDEVGFEDRYKTIYTRGEEKPGNRPDEDLFG